MPNQLIWLGLGRFQRFVEVFGITIDVPELVPNLEHFLEFELGLTERLIAESTVHLSYTPFHMELFAAVPRTSSRVGRLS